MADNILDILIRFGLSKEKATEAVTELKKIETQTQQTGKAAVKAEEEVATATDKTFASKKQLKDMLKQLGHEFPLLGQVGRLALNPIAFTTAGITAAFVIWKYRVDELTKSLGGVEMPDFKEGEVERIHRVAEAYGTLAEKMLAAGINAERASKQLELANKVIEANASLYKAMGVDTGTSPDEAKADNIGRTAIALAISAASKKQAAARFNAKNPFAQNLEKAATAAEIEKGNINARIKDIDEMRDANPLNPMNAIRVARFGARYGLNSSFNEAELMERNNLARQDSVIGRFANRSNQQAISNTFAKGAAEDKSESDKKLTELLDLLLKIMSQQRGNAFTGFGNVNQNNLAPGQGSLGDFVSTTGELVQSMAWLARSLDNMKKANEVLRQIVANNNQR